MYKTVTYIQCVVFQGREPLNDTHTHTRTRTRTHTQREANNTLDLQDALWAVCPGGGGAQGETQPRRGLLKK